MCDDFAEVCVLTAELGEAAGEVAPFVGGSVVGAVGDGRDGFGKVPGEQGGDREVEVWFGVVGGEPAMQASEREPRGVWQVRARLAGGCWLAAGVGQVLVGGVEAGRGGVA